MSAVTIYHNPECSKSRQTLALLKSREIQVNVVLYLESPPSVEKLEYLLNRLNMSARDLFRKGETAYKTQNLDNPALSDRQILQVMHENPILIERPIVETDNNACIGRPPESVLDIL